MLDLDRLDALRLRFDAQPKRFGVPYAEALRRAGQLEVAIAVMRTTLARAERNVLALGVLARCLRDLGHPEEAGIAVRTALALDPDDPVVSELAYLVPFAPTRSEEAPIDAVPVDAGPMEAVPVVEETPVAMVEETPVGMVEETPVVRVDEGTEAAGEESATMGRERAPFRPEPITESGPLPSVFVTQTMAELYVQQGLPGRAVAIYRELTMRAPNDARLAVRMAEVVALAEGQEVVTPPAIEAHDGASAAETVDEVPVDVLGDLPLLDDFDPIPMVESLPAADEERGVHRFAEDVSEPESYVDAPVTPSAFDFSEDAHRVAPMVSATDESMLAGLSFEAIALPTPASSGAGLVLPEGTGPSAREALRALAGRPATVRSAARPVAPPPPLRPTVRRTVSGSTRGAPVVPPPPADPTGDDFDQWLRGVS